MNAIARPMIDGSALSSDEWCTPKWLCDELGHFDLDPCSNDRSFVFAEIRVEKEADGLKHNWSGCSAFVNPPYSNVQPWATKLAKHESAWVALLKLDPTTKWWATLMSANPIIAPFRKRITFDGERKMTANFASVLVFKRWWPSGELVKHLWLPRWS